MVHAASRIGAVLCAALVLPIAGCKPAAEQAPPQMFVEDHGQLVVPADSPLRSRLSVVALGAGAGLQRLEAPAVVEADPARTTNILTPLTGRVTALKVRLGDRVRRGQVLAVIASGDLAQASSDVVKAQDANDLAARALERARGVQQAGGAAVKDLEAAESAAVQAKAELDRAKARLASLNGEATRRGADLVLTAPRDGVITALSISPGAQVSDPTATLMTLANLDRVFVTANVAEGDVGRISIGDDAEIALTAYPNRPIHGRVTEVDKLVQPDTRRQKVRIELGNAGGRLLPNMYAAVTFNVAPSAGAGSVFVPQSALLMNNDAISVFVEVRPWVFQRRAVQIGDETDDAARVLSGLAPGDRVVVKGGVLLND
jgi:cobalt-zinc-cadmium efflux system membrane fusion protein